MMKSPAVLVHPVLDMTHPSVQHIHSCIHFPPISHWVMLLVSRHTAVGSLRLHSNNPYLMQRRPQHATVVFEMCRKDVVKACSTFTWVLWTLLQVCVWKEKHRMHIQHLIPGGSFAFFLELRAKTRMLDLFNKSPTTELNPHTYL